MRILVVDDNPDDRDLEIREVRAQFPEALVIELIDLEEFEAALAEGAPDLVLTDLDLRWSSGREVLAAVKARYPACPLVMFTGTGTGDETIAVDLMKAGLDDFVVKSPRQLPRLRVSLKIAVDAAGSRAALTDREASLTRALAQQQVVVRELHHRVKNNLQTVASLLHLRGRMVDAATRVHLDEIAGRMEALGAVQSRIYESRDLDRVDFRATLTDIATSMIGIHRGEHATLANAAMEPLALVVARALPLSLVCYEVILNAMKYALPDGSPGTLAIGIADGESGVAITIADHGVGFVEGDVAEGMGSRLIRSMADETGANYGLVRSPSAGACISLRLR